MRPAEESARKITDGNLNYESILLPLSVSNQTNLTYASGQGWHWNKPVATPPLHPSHSHKLLLCHTLTRPDQCSSASSKSLSVNWEQNFTLDVLSFAARSLLLRLAYKFSLLPQSQTNTHQTKTKHSKPGSSSLSLAPPKAFSWGVGEAPLHLLGLGLSPGECR